MFVALILVRNSWLLIEVGGLGESIDTARSHFTNPALLDIFRGTTILGILSSIAWGLGYFGQPHIIVRFMAISSVKEIKKARRIGMGWMIFSMTGAMLTGFIGITYFSQAALHWITLKQYLSF